MILICELYRIHRGCTVLGVQLIFNPKTTLQYKNLNLSKNVLNVNVKYYSKITLIVCFSNLRDHPGTSYYLLEYTVNIHNSTKMAELHLLYSLSVFFTPFFE